LTAKKSVLPGQHTAPEPLLVELRQLIDSARQQTTAAVNMGLTLLYWRVGQRINAEVLQGERAAYGEQIVAILSQQLTTDYGRSFSTKNLRHMMRFADSFPNREIVSALSRQFSWSHFLEVIYLKDPLKRDFYAEMCRIERWSVRDLRERMGSMLYERTALARQPEAVIRQELNSLRTTDAVAAPLLLKDPYVLDFLGLHDRHIEKDLEDAILREMENFLLELGAGFSFVARQKRIQIDHDDFYIDLLFYNRKLRRLVAIDLKMDDFRAEHKGQMELYLRWLAKHEAEPGEASPLGIILCTGKRPEQIELLELDAAGIHVAEYLTVLPPPDVLQRQLHRAIETARMRIDARESPDPGGTAP
jgi:predicted nuclease of restriction endonuclease-like (RecB) superfamily